MKTPKLIFISLLLLCCGHANAQIDWGWSHWTLFSCDFEANCDSLDLHPEISGNLWQIGIPEKVEFDSAYSPYRALVTDSSLTYPASNHSYFDLVYIRTYVNPVISFYHKWDMDTLTEGAWIDISYDKGLTWINVIQDSSCYGSNWPSINQENLYGSNDTMTNGTPAFTGHSEGWVRTQMQWIWTALTKSYGPEGDTIIWRFHFLSDSTETSKDGWMIDDFEVFEVAPTGAVADFSQASSLKLWPNPANDYIYFENTTASPVTAVIYGVDGRRILKYEQFSGETPTIPVNALLPGIYQLLVYSKDGLIGTQRFIKK